MTVRDKKMKVLEALRDDLKNQISELQHKLAGVEMALKALSGGDASKQKVPIAKALRTNVKQTLLTLLDEVQTDGLNAAKAVELAEKRGAQLERGTVSSLLSRFKSDNIVTYDGTVYRLAKYSEAKAQETAEALH